MANTQQPASGDLPILNTTLGKLNAAQGVDFLKTRVYLYKYTPVFRPVGNGGTTQAYKLKQFAIDIDGDLKDTYFTRFDISRFVSRFSSTQSLDAGSITWSASLENAIVTMNDLQPGGGNNSAPGTPDSVRRPIFFPGANGVYADAAIGITADDLVTQIAQYKSDAVDDLVKDTLRIEIAMRLNGIADRVKRQALVDRLSSMTLSQQKSVLVTEIDPSRDGILLGDLIQRYDFVSAFVYSHPFIPAQTLEKAFTTQDGFASAVVNGKVNITTAGPHFFDREGEFLSLKPTSDTDSVMPFFEPEFNGFVNTVADSRAPGAVNTVHISGSGVLTPFDHTRVIFTDALLTSGLFNVAETMGVNKLSGFQSLFANLNPQQIVEKLLEAIYQIKRRSPGSSDFIFDLDSIKSRGSYDTTFNVDTASSYGIRQMFIIPILLFANVMRLRGMDALVGGVASNNGARSEGEGGSVVTSDDLTEKFKAFFIMISNAMINYVPSLKTPTEIIRDVKSSTYLEFFETPGGRIVFRTPQYNDTTPLKNGGGMLTSADITPISTKYSDTATNLLSKQIMVFGADLIGPLDPNYFSYANGKLISQYGLLSTSPQMNPNVRTAIQLKPNSPKQDQDRQDQSFHDGISVYCKFFLEYNNMKLRTASIEAVGNPLVQVGRTYFDIDNQKFGYIVKVTKDVTVGRTYTVNFSMNTVREAGFHAPGIPDVKRIPELIDIVSSFGNLTTTNIKPVQQVKLDKAAGSGAVLFNQKASTLATWPPTMQQFGSVAAPPNPGNAHPTLASSLLASIKFLFLSSPSTKAGSK